MNGESIRRLVSLWSQATTAVSSSGPAASSASRSSAITGGVPGCCLKPKISIGLRRVGVRPRKNATITPIPAVDTSSPIKMRSLARYQPGESPLTATTFSTRSRGNRWSFGWPVTDSRSPAAPGLSSSKWWFKRKLRERGNPGDPEVPWGTVDWAGPEERLAAGTCVPAAAAVGTVTFAPQDWHAKTVPAASATTVNFCLQSPQ